MTKAKASLQKKFELIFKVSEIELATDEMKTWKDCTEYIEKTLMNKTSLLDMTKILQKEVMKKEFVKDEELLPSQKIQIGLIYKSIIADNYEKYEEFLKLAQLLSDDSLNLFIEKFNYVIFSLLKIKPKYLNRLTQILAFLIQTTPNKMSLTISFFLRNIILGDFTGPLYEYYSNFFRVIWDNREIISRENPNLLISVFLKSIR